MEQRITKSETVTSVLLVLELCTVSSFLNTPPSVSSFGNSANTCSKMLKSLFPWKHNKTKQVMAAQPPMDEELILQEANLLPCHVCGRTFLPNPLKKHEKICEKNAIKRRKPFDSLKQRVAGTDLADFHQPTYLKKKEDPVVEKNPRQSKWKEKHLELVTAIRAAKGVPSDIMPSSPTPKPRSTTSFIASSAANERCPSCDRHFGPKAFDRHVEWCKERKTRIQQSPASVQQAKERLEARIKYRVPPLNKSKRTLIREKYSNNSNPHSPEPTYTKSTTSTTNLLGSFSRGPSIRKPKSLVNVEKTRDKLNRSDIEKCSGDKKRNSTEEDRKMSLSFGLPIIGSPSPKAESVKSLQSKRNPIASKKLNAVSINDQVESMRVSSINHLEVNKRMVTWKDTVKKSSSNVEKSMTQIHSTIPEIKNLVCSSECSKTPLRSHLEKDINETLVKQNASERIKNHTKQSETIIEKHDIDTAPVLSRNVKNPQKLAKEKTFCLRTTFQTKNEKLASKRPRDRWLDPDVCMETKSETLTSQDSSKTSISKILSSNDVVYKNKLSKIPTKRCVKNLFDVLKKYKKAPDKDLAKASNDGSTKKFKNDPGDIGNDIDNGKNTNDIGDSGENFEEITFQNNCFEGKCDGQQNLNKNLQGIEEKVQCFEKMKRGSLNLDENLKGVKELSDSFEDEEGNQVLDEYDQNSDHVITGDGHTGMNKWFDENFIEEPLDEDQYFKNTECLECGKSAILNRENRETSNFQDGTEGTSEKYLLEVLADKNNKFDNINSDIHRLSTKKVDGSNIYIASGIDKNTGIKLSKEKFEFSLKTDDFTPRNNFDKSTNVVYLFQSGTNLDLTRDNSQNTLTDKKSWSSLSTTKELNQICEESFLKETKGSNFSLRKSFSDMNALKNKSLMNFYQKDDSKKTLIPLFFKRRFVCESESVDFRKTCQDIRSISSVPIVHFATFKFKSDYISAVDEFKEVDKEKEDQLMPFSKFKFPYSKYKCNEVAGEEKKVDWADVGSKERLEILRIAAEKFIEEIKNKKPKGIVNFGSILEEDYSVPKKKRRVYLSDDSETNIGENTNRSEGFNFKNYETIHLSEELLKLNKSGDEEQEMSGRDGEKVESKKVYEMNGDTTNGEIDQTVPNSAASSVISEMTPRTLTLIEKIAKGRKLKQEYNDVLLAVSVSECERLLEIDKRFLKKVEKKIEKGGDKERIKLPIIVGENTLDSNKGQEVQVRCGTREKTYIKLPKIDQIRKLSQKRNCSKKGQDTRSDGEKKHFEIQSNASNYDPFEVAQRQFMELLECDDFKPFSPSDSPSRPHTTVPTPQKTATTPLPIKKVVKSADTVKKSKRESVIDPPVKFKDSLDPVTDNDDFELIENMINEHFGDADSNKTNGNQNGFYLHNLTQNKNSLTLDQILDNRKYSDDMSSSIDPRLINENDNLSIPEHFKIDDYSPTSTVDTDITLQNEDVDHYSAQYDSNIEAIEPKVDKKPLVKRSLSLVNRSKRDTSVTSSKTTKPSSNISSSSTKKGANSSKTTVSKPSKSHVSSSSSEKPSHNEGKTQKTEKKKSLPLLKRSMTLFDPSPKPSFKNKQEVNDYFNANESKTMSSSMTNSMTTNMILSMEKSMTKTNAQPQLEDPLKVEELFAVDDEMYEEYKKYEEMYLKEKEQNFNSNKKNKNKNIDLNYGLLTASEEEDHSNNSNNKLSNDSAYGSLRKTSKQRSRAPKLSPLDPKYVESTSSSGSENGLTSPAPPSSTQKVSKFCHECGTKFPVSTAKFCVECGVKRLVL